MSVICLQRSHQLPLNELKQKIDKIIVDMESKLEFKAEWESDSYLSFRRKGAHGFIEINETNFELTIKLGLMFRMLKNVIHNEVVAVIDEHL